MKKGRSHKEVPWEWRSSVVENLVGVFDLIYVRPVAITTDNHKLK